MGSDENSVKSIRNIERCRRVVSLVRGGQQLWLRFKAAKKGMLEGSRESIVKGEEKASPPLADSRDRQGAERGREGTLHS